MKLQDLMLDKEESKQENEALVNMGVYPLQLEEYDVTHHYTGEELECIYPNKIRVDGYNVVHFYDRDVPVYEIYDEEGNMISRVNSTSEMHEFFSEDT